MSIPFLVFQTLQPGGLAQLPPDVTKVEELYRLGRERGKGWDAAESQGRKMQGRENWETRLMEGKWFWRGSREEEGKKTMIWLVGQQGQSDYIGLLSFFFLKLKMRFFPHNISPLEFLTVPHSPP